MLDYDYFYAINNGTNATSLREINIQESKARLRDQLLSSPHYNPDAERNGEVQGLVITPSEALEKYKVEALPDETICVGDIIKHQGQYWIVQKVRSGSVFQTIGLMWLCNFEFRWQNWTPDVVRRWGVLDSGIYSSTKDGDAMVMTTDKQFRIYLPFDEDTRKLYVDKRLATERGFDASGREILRAYQITGFDSVSSSYGPDGHLLVLNARSADYVASKDDLDSLICDFIPFGSDNTETVDFDGTISGAASIRLGFCRRYTADFGVARWTVPDLDGLEWESDDNIFVLRLMQADTLIGETVTITAEDADGNKASFDVEVIG